MKSRKILGKNFSTLHRWNRIEKVDLYEPDIVNFNMELFQILEHID